MQLSFFRYGALRFPNRYCYAAHIHTYPGIKSNKTQQPTLAAAHSPQATNALSTLNYVGPGLHINASDDGVRTLADSEDQYTNPVGGALESNDRSQENQKQAFSDITLGLPDSSLGSTSTYVARQRVRDTLQQKLPHELLPAVLDASQDPGYMKSLPSTTFVEILEVLHPRHFVADFKHIYKDLHPNQVEAFRTAEFHNISAAYTSKIREIIARRLHAGRDLEIEEWRSLLQWVAYVGDGVTALDIWIDMVNCKIRPDLICYNFYFMARCWSGASFPLERHRQRVIPKTLQLRQLRETGQSHLQRLRGFQVGPGGLKDEITRMFAVMVNRGIMADAKTFGLLMTALSREGDLQGVKSVLKKVWEIDVDKILEGDQVPVKPRNLSTESPLYPTTDTLYAIAHIYGSNNELPTALRLVDFVSRKYSIAIPPEVWDELLEWAHVLSSPRRALRREDGTSQGQLPLKSVESLWNTMVSAPYNIRPDMRMYNHYCSNLFKRQMLHAMLHQMRAGLALYRVQATEYAELRRLHAMSSAECSEQPNWRDHTKIELSHQKIALGALTEYRNFLMVSRWFRLLLGGRRWGGGSDRVMIWERQELPNAVREFWHFRPRPVIHYHIATGIVEIAADKDGDRINRRPQQDLDGGHFSTFKGFNIRLKRKLHRAEKLPKSRWLPTIKQRHRAKAPLVSSRAMS